MYLITKYKTVQALTIERLDIEVSKHLPEYHVHGRMQYIQPLRQGVGVYYQTLIKMEQQPYRSPFNRSVNPL